MKALESSSHRVQGWVRVRVQGMAFARGVLGSRVGNLVRQVNWTRLVDCEKLWRGTVI